ncbi:Armadillo-type fold [Phytophthora cactorum]|nr:Armadillo-type fold [Phytophthora cactorum]
MARDDEDDDAQAQALSQLRDLQRQSEARLALRSANSAANLNLTRYVSECVAALADAPLKAADLAAAVKVASLLHQRYEDFAPGMVRTLIGSFEASYASEDKSKMLKRRLIYAYYANFTWPAKKSRGNMSITGSSTSSSQLEVPLLVSFAKSVGVDFLGVQPKKFKELEKILADNEEFQKFLESQTPVVPQNVQQECLSCYLEAYDMICKFYLAQHATFLKLDARNEKEEANRGEVTEEHREFPGRRLGPRGAAASGGGKRRRIGNGSILVWEGGDGAGRELSRDGPFDDEATRSFYEDLPDLLELVPAVVLGLTEADVAELKKKKETAAAAEEEAETEIPEEVTDDDGKDDTDDATLEDLGAKDHVVIPDEEEGKAKEETGDASTDTTHHQPVITINWTHLVNRDRCDKTAVEFCYRNSKATRSRLVKTLYAVPRTHLELLAHYARLVATLQSVLKEDIGGELVSMLVGEFHGLIKRRNQFRLESKIKNIRFLAELVKFRICPPNTGFRCLQRCFQDFQGHNVHVATTFLENCGRFLYCSKHTHARTVNCLNVMMKLKAAKHLDPQLETLVENAYYMCKPPERVERQAKQYDPMYLYLIKVLYQDLNGSNVNKVVKTLRRLPWQDSTTCGMVLKALLKVTKGKVLQIKWICEVVKGLSRYHDQVLVLLVDDVLEYIRYGLEVNDYRDHQRSLGYIKLLGELYNCGLVSMNVVVETLYLLINHSHDLLTLPQYTSDKVSAAQLLDMKKRFLLVPDMRYDPRVPSEVDGPTEVFRVRLVSALIETCNGSGSASNSVERGISRPRLGRFMVFFQRYLFSKTDVPLETEFVVFDLFEMLASSLKDHFKKFDTWEDVDGAVQEILRGTWKKPSEEELLIIHDRVQKSEEDEDFEKAFKSMMHGTADPRKPAARVNVDKMAIPTVVKSSAALTPAGALGALSRCERISRWRGGKVEARQLVVPEASSLAQHSHRQENAGKKEQSELKRLVLQNMERDDFMIAKEGQQANENRIGFGGGSEWNNAEFGLRRGKGYRGTK